MVTPDGDRRETIVIFTQSVRDSGLSVLTPLGVREYFSGNPNSGNYIFKTAIEKIQEAMRKDGVVHMFNAKIELYGGYRGWVAIGDAYEA